MNSTKTFTHTGKTKMFTVIIPTYRNPDYLDLCLSSLLTGQDNINEVIVIVDGYVSESQHLIDKYQDTPNVRFIEFDDNRGMQMAINLGVYNATNSRLFIVNDDNVFPLHWDTQLLLVPFDPDTIITANQIEPTGPSAFNFHIQNFGTTVHNFNYDKFCRFEQKISSSKVTSDGGIFPFVISKRNFMIVNGFDTLYNSPFICDWDFFLKLELMGCKFVKAHNCHLYHFGSIATKNRTTETDDSVAFTRGEMEAHRTFEYKWGFRPQMNKNNSHLPRNFDGF